MIFQDKCKQCGCEPDNDKCGRLEKTPDGELDIWHNGCECHDSYPLGGAS